MSDDQRPAGDAGPDRRGAGDRLPRVDMTDVRGSVGTPIADGLQQTPSAIGDAVMEALMAFLRGNTRNARRAGRMTAFGALLAGAKLARARRNRAARNSEENNRVVHPANPAANNHADVTITRIAREETGNRELTGRIRAAITANPDVPAAAKEQAAGPGGDAAVDRLLASIEHTDVAAALALPQREDQLIDRVGREWRDALGFGGDFADAWRHAAANPAIGERAGAPAAEPPSGAWARFAEWDPATRPSDENLVMLNGAWLSAVASLDAESEAVRRAIEPVVARWEPLVAESYQRALIREAALTGGRDLQSGALDRISAIETAMVHADTRGADEVPDRPGKLPDAWQRVLESPETLHGMDDRRLRDLVDSWAFHSVRYGGRAMPLAETAEAALHRFGEHLAAANPETSAEYERRRERGEAPAHAYAEVSRLATGHLFDPDSRLVTTGDEGEPPARDQRAEQRAGRAAHPAGDLVRTVHAGEQPSHHAFTGADFAEQGAVDPQAGLATLGGKYRRANHREPVNERSGTASR